MDEKEAFVDFYKVLHCDRTASTEELKKSYQRLVLTSHPDKNETQHSKQSFLLIQRAWSVLRDPECRKQYDATLSCYEHSECLLYDTVSKSEMELDLCQRVFTYPCRCGGTYLFDASDTDQSNVVIGCDECSFSILVKDS